MDWLARKMGCAMLAPNEGAAMSRAVSGGIVLLVLLGGVLAAFQRGRFRGGYDEPLVLPSDAAEKTEFYFTRLQYPNLRASGMWSMRGSWSVDYPKADRHFVQGVRRLSRIHVRSVEQVVNLVDDSIFDHPFVYVVEPGHWDLPESQARKMREFTDRGGFLMTDDFHGTYEWAVFTASLNRAFGDRSIVDLDNSDPIFHVLYDLDQRFQVPGIVMFYTGQTYEYDGVEAKWRAVRDEKGRIVMAICQNMDLGDAWEHADEPRYPEHYSSLAYRVGINYIIYAMTH
jgi:hypothetical protein